MIRLFIISSLVTFKVATAHADCQEIRLDLPGGSLANVPVMDQDGSGLCYTYSGSQMIDAYRFSHGDTQTSHLTSPFISALRYKAEDVSSPGYKGDSVNLMIDAGQIDELVSSVAQHGSCSRTVLSSDWVDSSHIDHTEISEISSQVDRLRESLLSGQTPDSDRLYTLACALQQDFFVDLKSDLQSLTEVVSKIPEGLVKKGFPLADQNGLYVLDKLLSKKCESDSVKLPADLKVSMVKCKNYTDVKDVLSSYKKMVSENLTNNTSQPIGLTYNPAFLTSKRQARRSCLSKSRLSRFSDGTANPADGQIQCNDVGHASLIVGQRQNKKGVCQLLIRNSFGVSCNPYTAWDCENGQIWVDEDVVLRNTESLSTIK